jgi:hypothetical protein
MISLGIGWKWEVSFFPFLLLDVIHKVASDSEVQSCLDRHIEERYGLCSYGVEWRDVTALDDSSMSHHESLEH